MHCDSMPQNEWATLGDCHSRGVACQCALVLKPVWLKSIDSVMHSVAICVDCLDAMQRVAMRHRALSRASWAMRVMPIWHAVLLQLSWSVVESILHLMLPLV